MRVEIHPLYLNLLIMKVEIIKTGEVVDVTPERANYWIRCNVAKEVVEKPKKTKK